ncbi:MAG TPA: hypothetical protein VMV77_12785 [Bacteroidales bacterium]|nr:hypothetical protein [Bacteroidales bacterium]
MDNFYSTTIRSLSIQFLETLYILDNSKTIETIQSRIEFLENVTDRLKNLNNNPDYQYSIQLAIDDYSVRYFNRIPDEPDLSRLSSPHSFDLEAYCITSLINGLKRYFEEQLNEIELLKSNSSKEKRISKVLHNILSAKNYLQMKFSESISYTTEIEEIEKMVTKMEKNHETI